MPLSFQQFQLAVARDVQALKDQQAPKGLTCCDACGVPLQESVTGNRPVGGGAFHCSDCYFDALGDELDEHPLGAIRAVRGA